jgi:hypothetical protein
VDPKPPLPKPPLASFEAAFGYPLALFDGLGKIAANQSPPLRKTVIARWLRPNTMQMIRQNHNGICLERVLLAYSDESLAQCVNVIHQQPIAFALDDIDSEE